MVSALWTDLIRRLDAIATAAATRRALATMPDHLLADVGLDRATVDAALDASPFWQAPSFVQTPGPAKRPVVATVPRAAFSNLAAA
jgi:uncharacterized protein YjiS (DUF1127 family)